MQNVQKILKVVKIDTHLLFRIKGVYPKPYICIYIYIYIYTYMYMYTLNPAHRPLNPDPSTRKGVHAMATWQWASLYETSAALTKFQHLGFRVCKNA